MSTAATSDSQPVANFTESRASIGVRETLAANQIELHSRLLGIGSYSKVFSAYSSKHNQVVAIKRIDKRKQNLYTRSYLPREVKLVGRLNHPNVIKVFEVIETPDYICMIEEYASNSDLLRLIKSRLYIDEIEGRLLFRQFVEGLRYLEREQIIHRDLKCENLFLDSYFNLKIGDFSFARYLLEDETTNTFCGSKAYAALEIMKQGKYRGNSVDIWSAGVVLYTMLTGRMPFNHRRRKEMIATQQEHRIRFPHGMPSEPARKLIMQMLHPDPQKRATLDKILGSEWLATTMYMVRGFIPPDYPYDADDSDCLTAREIAEPDLQALRRSKD